MNTKLCEKCGATIPLRTVDGGNALPSSHHACKICDPPEMAQGKKGPGGMLIHALGIFLFASVGIGLQKCSFDKVAEIRQLARVPKTDVQAAVPGEINLRGAATPLDGDRAVLKSPDTNSTCLYYRYLVERKKTDSDGKTHWVTETNQSAYVPQFLLRDKTGEIVVRPSNRVDFNVPESNQRRSGSRRYTEFRLDPGDATFVFGYAESTPGGDGLSIGFDRVGDYQPLISEKTELKERTGRATSSIIACWAGLVLIGATTILLFSLTGQHRLLAYFWVLSGAVGLVLVFLGVAMMRSDLRAAHEHVVRQDATVRTVIAAELAGAGIGWDRDWRSLGDITRHLELDETQRQRLRRVRIDLAAAARRVRGQSTSFPYNLIASSLDLAPLVEPPLPPADEESLAELETGFQQAKLSGFGAWLWGIGGLVGAFLATLGGFRSVKLKRMTENLATSPTKGVAYGLTELKGVIDLPEGIDPLQGPLSHNPCVTFDYRIDERRGSGKRAKWVQIHREEKRCQFLCRDREGTFPIDPTGADLMGWRKDTRREGKLRYIESRLQFGDPLYAIGMAAIDPDTGDSLYLCKPEPKDEPFVLSSFTEKAVVAKRGIRAIAWLTGAFALVLLAGLMLLASRGAFSPADYLAAGLVGPAYLVMLTLILHYNDLVFLRQRARRNWSNIEVSLRKRYDLVPAMIEVAKAYMSHEKTIQTQLAALRGGYGGGVGLNPEMAGELLEQGRAIGGAFLGLVEDNPDLQASTQTSLVIRQLVALEDEIAFMRAGYNDAVTQYNTRIAVLPDSLLAKLGKFFPMDLLDYESEVLPIPEIARETWRRQQRAETAEATASHPPDVATRDAWTAAALPIPDPGATVVDAIGERAHLYANLLDETGDLRALQLGIIRDAEGQDIADAAAAQAGPVQRLNPWARLSMARAMMPNLRQMTADAYLHFKGVARLLIESDDRITTYEYAFEKALGFLVDPVFVPSAPPEIRHTSIGSLTSAVTTLQAHLSAATQEENLGSYDAAISEVFHATAELRNEVYHSCHRVFVSTGGEDDPDRCMLIQSLSDGLFLAPGE